VVLWAQLKLNGSPGRFLSRRPVLVEGKSKGRSVETQRREDNSNGTVAPGLSSGETQLW